MAESKQAVKRRRSSEVKKEPVKPYDFDVPSWAGKPTAGMHFDVSKGGTFVEKLMADEKKYYLVGRNRDQVDFTVDHASCSRVHAALVFHRHLQRMFLIDLGSTHGTFIGSIRLEPNRPMQVPVDTTLAFGASTRRYTLREKPVAPSGALSNNATRQSGADGEKSGHGLLGLPESDTELDDLTEYNTAHNRRTASVSNEDAPASVSTKKRRHSSSTHVVFKPLEEVINPEDVDPSVGRFRNLVQTEVVVPQKKQKLPPSGPSLTDSITKRMQSVSYVNDLYADLPVLGGVQQNDSHAVPMHTAIGAPKISSAPEVEEPNMENEVVAPPPPLAKDLQVTIKSQTSDSREGPKEAPKKKYAKEAWPGKKSGPNLLSV